MRNKHKTGFSKAGISIKKGIIAEDLTLEHILQPALVSSSALTLATEVTRMILKIDDLVNII